MLALCWTDRPPGRSSTTSPRSPGRERLAYSSHHQIVIWICQLQQTAILCRSGEGQDGKLMGQYGELGKVVRLFNGKKNGFFIECGALDGGFD